MTIALTGGTGFVGRAVIGAARASGERLRALARSPQEARDGVEWVHGALDDVEALRNLVGGCRAVVHLAGLTTASDAAAFHAVNVEGTRKLVAAMRDAGVARLVFVSSLAAREPALSAYGASKAEAERMVEGCGLDWTIVRPPGVYGPGDVDYFEMFRSARLGLVPLPPPGASSLIHVDDLARLLLALVDAPSELVHHALYEPDDGRAGGWTHRALAQAIGRAMGRRVFAPHLPRRALALGARIDRLVRGRKARLTADRVGYISHPDWVAAKDRRVPPALWTPRIAGEEGLAATAAWYRANGWL